MDNLAIYNRLSTTPKEARKTIEAGRLKGFTDINPMWRIKAMTEAFGPCGFGWTVTVTEREIIQNADGTACCFVQVALKVKVGDEWSEPIYGEGGSSYIASESRGLRASDEAFKMAYTDAIGSACKLLGMSADIYFEKDRTKYTAPAEEKKAAPADDPKLAAQKKELSEMLKTYCAKNKIENIKEAIADLEAKYKKQMNNNTTEFYIEKLKKEV